MYFLNLHILDIVIDLFSFTHIQQIYKTLQRKLILIVDYLQFLFYKSK